MELKAIRRELRWFGLWLAVGWVLVGVVVYLSLTPHPVEIDLAHGDKLGHMLAYAGLMTWFAQLYQRRAHAWWGIGFIALGIALEYMQGWTGYRDFEYLDMLADGAGVTAGWLLGGTAIARLLGGFERRFNG